MIPIWKNIKRIFFSTFQTTLSPVTLFFWVTAVVVATIAGPFGTIEALDWPARAVFWLVVVTVSIVLGYCVRALTVALVGVHRPGLFDLVAIGLMTVVFAPIARLIALSSHPHESFQVPSLWVFVGYVCLISAAIFVGRRLIPGLESGTYSFLSPPEPGANQPRLMRRLPMELRGPVLRVSASDHFVEVVTSKGVKTLRLRLADAIDEMEPEEGYSVHRSHWVSRAAIAGIERQNAHKLFVVLTNGDQLPVSRKYRSNLENAGLLD